MARAAAVRDFLTAEKGVDGSRIKIESKGEKDPAKENPLPNPIPIPAKGIQKIGALKLSPPFLRGSQNQSPKVAPNRRARRNVKANADI
jgi:outer membrane protein OmpA-like peptidoglycan-associated protein